MVEVVVLAAVVYPVSLAPSLANLAFLTTSAAFLADLTFLTPSTAVFAPNSPLTPSVAHLAPPANLLPAAVEVNLPNMSPPKVLAVVAVLVKMSIPMTGFNTFWARLPNPDSPPPDISEDSVAVNRDSPKVAMRPWNPPPVPNPEDILLTSARMSINLFSLALTA